MIAFADPACVAMLIDWGPAIAPLVLAAAVIATVAVEVKVKTLSAAILRLIVAPFELVAKATLLVVIYADAPSNLMPSILFALESSVVTLALKVTPSTEKLIESPSA